MSESRYENILRELGLSLPEAPAAVGAYLTTVRMGNIITTSGQLPWKNGKLVYQGKLGTELSIEEGYEAAKICALNALAQFKKETGSLDAIRRLLRVEGYVHSGAGFRGHPKVLDGASDLFNAVFGENGRHVRTALGINEMPLNAAIQLVVWAEVG